MSLIKNKPKKEHSFDINKQSDLTKRVISSVFLLIFLAVYVGLSIIYTQGTWNGLKNADIAGYFNFAITLILSGAGAYELMRAMGVGEKNKLYYIPGMIAVMFLVFFPFSTKHGWALTDAMNLENWYEWYYVFIGIILSIVVFALISYYTNKSIKNAIILTVYMFVVAIGFKGFSQLSLSMEVIGGVNDPTSEIRPSFGFNTVIWIWMIIILTDTFAYFGGRKFGKNKLAPKISPKKTVEGSAVGTLVSVVIGTLYAVLFYYLLINYAPFGLTLSSQTYNWVPGVLLFLLALLITFASQIGDLFFSWYKRLFDTKDFSRLIPGHGGILDRLDSFLFVFFIMYFIGLAA